MLLGVNPVRCEPLLRIAVMLSAAVTGAVTAVPIQVQAKPEQRRPISRYQGWSCTGADHEVPERRAFAGLVTLLGHWVDEGGGWRMWRTCSR